jgi:hypothetical protein
MQQQDDRSRVAVCYNSMALCQNILKSDKIEVRTNGGARNELLACDWK